MQSVPIRSEKDKDLVPNIRTWDVIGIKMIYDEKYKPKIMGNISTSF